ncbi:MAG TPA: aldehyde dehydrogenase (NADP(+)) [Stellaceae bacterium]|nr:aldehyde dehydrogenase (NADP(+)) [Stellaceae bacterium]
MTKITGDMLIGSEERRGHAGEFRGIDPKTGETLAPTLGNAGAADVRDACRLAAAAFDTYRETPREARASFLEAIGEEIVALGDALIDRACTESGLPRGRIEGERGRTVGQLKLFAGVLRDGSFVEPRIDPALPDRKPLARSDLRQRHIALGPVAVFGASNFPLAFSVAGGDTASALAAGCPVVVKAHPAHPGTSELVGRAIRAAVRRSGLPDGVFSLVVGNGIETGGALVGDPDIKAVGFTGSRQGGLALVRIAAGRPEPIPVFAEMSSINPVFLLPDALASRAEAIGRDFVASLVLGSGQFCTNPGLVLAVDGPDLERFLESAAAALPACAASTMLTPGIHGAYATGVQQLLDHPKVRSVARGAAPSHPNDGQAALFTTDLASFLGDHRLQAEVFGASSLVVRCPNVKSMRDAAEVLEGQLTATLQMTEADTEAARLLLPVLERKAGRILVNGYPTGVEVGHAMVHGGPFPATSAPSTTSVGSLAIRRFLRPVCYQDLPASLLPPILRDGNPEGVWRRIDGALGKE